MTTSTAQDEKLSLLTQFKKFIARGNVVDLAVGVMIGAAFQGIVTAFTDGIVTPLLNALGGQPDVPLKIWHFDVGMVINSVLSFLITATIIFFIIVKPTGKLLDTVKSMANADKEAERAELAEEVALLREIRDYLRPQAGTAVQGPSSAG